MVGKLPDSTTTTFQCVVQGHLDKYPGTEPLNTNPGVCRQLLCSTTWATVSFCFIDWQVAFSSVSSRHPSLFDHIHLVCRPDWGSRGLFFTSHSKVEVSSHYALEKQKVMWKHCRIIKKCVFLLWQIAAHWKIRITFLPCHALFLWVLAVSRQFTALTGYDNIHTDVILH